VNPEQTTPPYILGGPGEPDVNNRPSHSCCAAFTALLGGPEVDVPAGYVDTVYEPQYVLSADKLRYNTVTGTVRSKLPNPMPISLTVWAGPGSDSTVIKVGSAYEAATHHRAPPSAFGPLPVNPKSKTRINGLAPRIEELDDSDSRRGCPYAPREVQRTKTTGASVRSVGKSAAHFG